MSTRYNNNNSYKRNRHGAPYEHADDEDSDIEDFEDLDLEDFRSVSGGVRNGRRESTRSLRGGRNRKNSTQSSFDYEDEESEEIRTTRGKSNRSSRGASLARSVNNDWISSKRNEIAKKERDLIRNDPRASKEKRDSFDSPLSVSESDREKKTGKKPVNGNSPATEEAKLVKEILEETQNILQVKGKKNKKTTEVVKESKKEMVKETVKEVLKESPKTIKQEVKKKEPSPPPSPPKEEIVVVEVEVVEELESESGEEEEEEESIGSEEVEEEESEEDPEELSPIPEPPKKLPTPEPTKQPSPVLEEVEDEPLGPPPEAPTHEWECEYCTYVNEPNTKICSICCKTISSNHPKLIIQKQDTPSPPRQTQAPPAIQKPEVPPVNGHLSTPPASTPPKATPESQNEAPKKPIASSLKSSKPSDANDPSKKGRTRKISFWPGLTTTNKPAAH